MERTTPQSLHHKPWPIPSIATIQVHDLPGWIIKFYHDFPQGNLGEKWWKKSIETSSLRKMCVLFSSQVESSCFFSLELKSKQLSEIRETNLIIQMFKWTRYDSYEKTLGWQTPWPFSSIRLCQSKLTSNAAAGFHNQNLKSLKNHVETPLQQTASCWIHPPRC